MTKEELNQAICTQRNEGRPPNWSIPFDWTSDEKWPTLFREMPDPMVWKESARLWGCDADEGITVFAADLGTAVCEAWLKWKAVVK